MTCQLPGLLRLQATSHTCKFTVGQMLLLLLLSLDRQVCSCTLVRHRLLAWFKALPCCISVLAVSPAASCQPEQTSACGPNLQQQQVSMHIVIRHTLPRSLLDVLIDRQQQTSSWSAASTRVSGSTSCLLACSGRPCCCRCTHSHHAPHSNSTTSSRMLHNAV